MNRWSWCPIEMTADLESSEAKKAHGFDASAAREIQKGKIDGTHGQAEGLLRVYRVVRAKLVSRIGRFQIKVVGQKIGSKNIAASVQNLRLVQW